MFKYLFFILMFIASMSWATTVVTFFKPAGGSPTCTRLITQDDTNDYWCNDGILAQGLKISASTEVCEVQIYGDSMAPPNGQIEFWSGAGGTGTQYGTASENKTIAANAWTTFTWSSNPTLTTDCYLVVRIDGSPPDDFCWKSYTSATKYETSSYAAMRGGAAIDSGDHDFAFRLNSMQ